jgi:hypothetical protein
VDGYVSAGWERDVVDTDDSGGTRVRNPFVSERGIKLRVNIHHTPLKLLAKLGTDFWGLRVGIRAGQHLGLRPDRRRVRVRRRELVRSRAQTPADALSVHQERAHISPVWYRP